MLYFCLYDLMTVWQYHPHALQYRCYLFVEDLMCTMCRALDQVHFPVALLIRYWLSQWLRFCVWPENFYCQDKNLAVIIYLLEGNIWWSLNSSHGCQTLSNSWLTSIKTSVQYWPFSIALLAMEYALLTRSIVEWYVSWIRIGDLEWCISVRWLDSCALKWLFPWLWRVLAASLLVYSNTHFVEVFLVLELGSLELDWEMMQS